ncbi:chaplin [Streptomyces carpinensis]|uniref:Chaplin n=1 Tax=Streptomyces carpinensis TaxID=66369 RepID=A0ABV1W6X6_9ACTN|nr:chaplin [Streptomyces carpinensis]
MKKSVAVVTGAVLALGVAGPAFANSGATGGSADSAGVISGNTIQIPLHAPINLCGNTVDVIGLLNPAFGHTCANA